MADALVAEPISCEKLEDKIVETLYYVLYWARNIRDDGHGLYRYVDKMRDVVKTDSILGALKGTRIITRTELAVTMSILKLENIKRSVKIAERVIVELDKMVKTARACWGGDGV